MENEAMTAAEFDVNLEAATERLRHSTLALEKRNQQLEELILRKEAVADRLETAWQEAQTERARIDAEIARLLAEPARP